jgi:hypothetical protein
MESRYRRVLLFGSLVMLIALGIRYGFGVIAGLVNLPIDERPLRRLRPSPAGGSSGSSA